MLRQLAVLSALGVSSVYGHAFINSVAGANGISALGLGVTFNGEVARGGTVEQPFQLDTPVLKDTETNPCGATLLAGSVDIAASMAKVSAAMGGMPQIPDNGVLEMGVFQVNADGGGPFIAEINTDATGAKWTAIEVLKQAPGVNGILHNGPANSSLTVQVPSGVTCTGPGSSCLIRLNNGGPTQPASLSNGAGPFGGCVAVSQLADATAATATTATTTGNTGKTGGRKSKNNRALAETDLVRRFDELLERGLSPLMEARAALEAEILAKRQLLTAQLLDELSTATGTAIDIPIDRFAGHDDASLQGGNSTSGFDKATAILSTQQAIDLKKAVQGAITQAMALIASNQVDAGAGGQDSTITDAENAAANKAQADGTTTSINAGNAGVGFFQTAVVESLISGIATATAALVDASATAVAATATATTSTQKGKGGKAAKAAAAAKGAKQANVAAVDSDMMRMARMRRSRFARRHLEDLE